MLLIVTTRYCNYITLLQICVRNKFSKNPEVLYDKNSFYCTKNQMKKLSVSIFMYAYIFATRSVDWRDETWKVARRGRLNCKILAFIFERAVNTKNALSPILSPSRPQIRSQRAKSDARSSDYAKKAIFPSAVIWTKKMRTQRKCNNRN